VVFLDVTKAFDAIWIDGLLFKQTILNSPSYLVQTISAYLWGRKFEASFQMATSSCRVIRVWVAQGGLISPILVSLYVNDMPTPSHHVELALYASDMAIIATSRNPTLLVSYLELYLSDLQRWLTEWRITINVSKRTAIIFARAGRRYIKPRSFTLFGEPIKWVDTTRYLGMGQDIRLIWSPHIDQVKKKTDKGCPSRLIVLGTDQLNTFWMPSLKFFHNFSSVVRQFPGYIMRSCGSAHTPTPPPPPPHQGRCLHLCDYQQTLISSL
jgi:hypothetical protein